MISSYTNYTCTVERSSGLNTQGEIGTFSEVASALPIFMSYKSRQIDSARGWLRAYDALGYVDSNNLDSYNPAIEDKWIFDNGNEYSISYVEPLRGMGQTHYGWRCELKAITQSGIAN